MKKTFLQLSIILLIGITASQFFMLGNSAEAAGAPIAAAKKCLGLPSHRQLIKFPAKIKTIDRILTTNTKNKELLMVVREADNKIALWKYADKKFTQVFKPASSVDNTQAFIYSVGPYFYFEINPPENFYRSSDNGATWQFMPANKEMFWGMAKDNDGIYYGSAWSYNSPVLYISYSNGLDWYPWLDFQKIFPEYAVPDKGDHPPFQLRHLHDLAISDGNILVGTGDVARFTFLSQDKGTSWKKVWDEGFTAHLFLPDNKIILAGDKPNVDSVVYDFGTQATSTSWSPKKFGWSGYVYSLLAKNNKYFLASHLENGVKLKYGVMGSCDGYNWQAVWGLNSARGQIYNSVFLADGPGKIIYLSMNGKLYQLY